MWHVTHPLSNQRGISTFRGVAIVLVETVIVFFVFYFLYFFWIENPTPTSDILIVRAFNHQQISIPKQVATAGWQEYDDSTRGFSFSYPPETIRYTDTVAYNGFDGTLVSVKDGSIEIFGLRIFPLKGEETIPQAFERLTGVKPSIYQSYEEKVGDTKAMVYRLKPRQKNGDTVYMIHKGYLFEVPLTTSAAQILATINFATK